jgi:hypothetical protein
LKSPTNSFFFVSTEITGCRAARAAVMRIPTHPGHLFQLDGGHRSDLMAATIPN